MKKTFLIIFFFSALQQPGNAQSATTSADSTRQQKTRDSIQSALRDSLRFVRLDSLGTFPLIDGGKYSKVLPVKDIDEFPDMKHPYRLLFELTAYKPDTGYTEINAGLTEIARIINLHVAAGIPLAKLDMVIIAHGMVFNDLMTDSAFKLKFKKVNPNTRVIKEFMKLGVRFIVCGQAMEFFEFSRDQLVPGIKKALTAKVVISDYVSRGYVKYDIINE